MKRLNNLSKSKSIVFLLLSIFLFGGCSKKNDVPGGPGTNEVWMQNTAFKPSNKTIVKETTITWTNKDSYNHTVTSSTAGIFDSGELGQNQTFSYAFNTVGTFSYYCKDHSGMTGTMVVQ